MSKIVVVKTGSQVSLDPIHSGFAHGFGIFETIRLFAGRLCFWEAHCERLFRSAKAFNMSFDQTGDAVLNAIKELVQTENFRDVLIKVSLLRADEDTHCYVYARPVAATVGKVRLKLAKEAPLNEHALLAGHKTHNYMEAMHLLKTVRSDGFSDLIRINTAGFLAETTVANLFFIEGEVLHTPDLSTGILPGVVRAEVLTLAKALSMHVEEGLYPIEKLQKCSVVFMTNASIGIQPVAAIESGDVSIELETSHPMINRLKTALADAEMRKSIQLI